MDKEKYKRWDGFIANVINSLICGEDKFKYFILTELDYKNYYDLLFFAVAFRANQFTNCKLYCYPKNFFKFLQFKWFERAARYIRRDAKAALYLSRTHICNKRERAELIETLALKNNIELEEISQIYKEYYGR